MPVILVFALSIGACFAGGGYSYAITGQGKHAEEVRDDPVVKVSVGTDGTFTAAPKSLEIPLPSVLKFLEKFIEP
jgi:hypothetical protein